MIEDVEDRIRKLPEQDIIEPPVTTFQKTEDGWDQVLVRMDLGGKKLAFISIINGSNDLLKYEYSIASSQLQFCNDNYYVAYNPDKHEVSAENGVPKGIMTTREQAIAQAQEMIDKLGIPDMRLAVIRPAYLLIDYTSNVIEDVQAWQLVFTRQVEGIPVSVCKDNMASTISGAMSYGAYNADFSYEAFSATVDDTGISSFRWWGPMEFVNTLNENATLLPFCDIQERIEKQLSIKYAAFHRQTEITKVQATSIQLGYMRVRVKDTQDQYMLIPVWDVYGYNDETSWMNGKQKLNPQNHIETLLTINAIDGSNIDRNLGY